MKTKLRSVLKEAVKEVSPDNSIVKESKKVLKLIDSELVKRNINAKCFLGGSVAKNTFLKGSSDCDVFVRFNYKEYKDKRDKLSDILAKVLKKFNPVRVHGSRDYFQFFYNNIKFEVVPVLKITNPNRALNIMDASPLHVLWFKKHSDEKICNSVRLMKLFCKANGCYGAESFIRGFSGHVIDILSVYYGSFTKILKIASSDWERSLENNEKIIIDVEKYYKSRVLFELNTSKTEGPLVVVDPVQKERNAAASLSYEKFRIFTKAAVKFLKKPSMRFFKIKEFDEKKLVDLARKNKKFLVLIRASPVLKSEDVAGCKLLKVYNFLIREILRYDFVIEKKGFYWDKKLDKYAVFYFIIKKPLLFTLRTIKGPSLKFKQGVENFKRSHGKTFVEKGFMFAIEKRQYKNIKALLKHIVNQDYVNQKVRAVRINYFSK